MSRMIQPRAIQLALIASLACVAADLPDAVFQSRRLVRIGNVLVLAKPEADVHDAARRVRTAKAKLGSETAAIRDADAAVARAQSNAKQVRARWGEAAAAMADHPKDNAYIGRHNALLVQLDQAEGALRVALDRRQRVTDAHGAYVTAVLAAVTLADVATAAYKPLASDEAISDALVRANAAVGNGTGAARPPLTLGPSPAFNADLAFITACSKDAREASIPIDNSRNVPVLDVTFGNGVHRRMLWDSGASSVSLSAPAASAGGIRVPPDAPTVSMVTAEGRSVRARSVVADSLRVGPFTVRNVACVVMPTELGDVDCLVGGTFQSHFVSRVELNRGLLSLTPLDADVATAGTPTTAPASPVAPARGSQMAPVAVRDAAARAVDGQYRDALVAADRAMIVQLDKLHEQAVRAGDPKGVAAVDTYRQEAQDRVDANEPNADAFGYTNWRFNGRDSDGIWTVSHDTASHTGAGGARLRWVTTAVVVARWNSGWTDRLTLLDDPSLFIETWSPEHEDRALTGLPDSFEQAFPVGLRLLTNRWSREAAPLLTAHSAANRAARDARLAALAQLDQKLLADLAPLIARAALDTAHPGDLESLAAARTDAQTRLSDERPPRFKLPALHWAFRHGWMHDAQLNLDGPTPNWTGDPGRGRPEWRGNVLAIHWANGYLDKVTFLNGLAFMQSWTNDQSAGAPLGVPPFGCGIGEPAK